MNKAITISLPEDLIVSVKNFSQGNGSSFSGTIRVALVAHLNQNKVIE